MQTHGVISGLVEAQWDGHQGPVPQLLCVLSLGWFSVVSFPSDFSFMSFYVISPPVKPWKDCHCSRQFQFLTPSWMFSCPSDIYASSNAHCNQLLCFGDCITKITLALKQLSPQNCLFSSVAQSCPTLQPHESQHARPPCPSPTPRVHSNSLTSIESVMPSSHLILCRPLLLLPPVPPSISLLQWVNSLHEVAKVLEFQL